MHTHMICFRLNADVSSLQFQATHFDLNTTSWNNASPFVLKCLTSIIKRFDIKVWPQKPQNQVAARKMTHLRLQPSHHNQHSLLTVTVQYLPDPFSRPYFSYMIGGLFCKNFSLQPQCQPARNNHSALIEMHKIAQTTNGNKQAKISVRWDVRCCYKEFEIFKWHLLLVKHEWHGHWMSCPMCHWKPNHVQTWKLQPNQTINCRDLKVRNGLVEKSVRSSHLQDPFDLIGR